MGVIGTPFGPSTTPWLIDRVEARCMSKSSQAVPPAFAGPYGQSLNVAFLRQANVRSWRQSDTAEG